MKLRIAIIALFGLLLAPQTHAQVLRNGSCFVPVTGTSAQCNVGGINAGKSTMAIGCGFTTNICATINVPAGWSEIGCAAFGSSSSAVVYYQAADGSNILSTVATVGSDGGGPFITLSVALTTSLPPNGATVNDKTSGAATTFVLAGSTTSKLYLASTTNFNVNDSIYIQNPLPTFTWTGSSTATCSEIQMEGVALLAQLDTSTTNTGSSTTSMTANSVTTTAYLDHLVNWYFTDNAASGVTFTSPAAMGLMVSFNSTSYDSFVTETRPKLPSATGAQTGTASSSSNYAAFTMAFKSLTPTVARTLDQASINCPNNSSCVSVYDTTGAVHSVVSVDGSNTVQINNGGSFQVINENANTIRLGTNAGQDLQAETNTVEVSGTFQITANNAPSATCTGGSTGVLVETGNSNCTASLTPFPCCTGNNTGTCKKSNNNTGTVLTSSVASTGCTLSFNASNWLNTETCTVSDGSGSASPTIFAMGVPTTSGFTVNFSSATSKVFNYMCM